MDNPIAVIDYTNWRGDRSLRTVVPIGIRFTSNEWHPDPQWMLEALDLDKREMRSYAMASIHSWNIP